MNKVILLVRLLVPLLFLIVAGAVVFADRLPEGREIPAEEIVSLHQSERKLPNTHAGYPRTVSTSYTFGEDAIQNEPPRSIDLFEGEAISLDNHKQPCSDSGQPSDSCEVRNVSRFNVLPKPEGTDIHASQVPEPSVEDILEFGYQLKESSPVHLAIRGTASVDSTRCSWRVVARTQSQRENAIRGWLKIGTGETIPDTSYLRNLFTATFDVLNPRFRETIKANFMALVYGESAEYLFLTCFADYTSHEYLLGNGPTNVTIAYDRMGGARSYDLYLREYADGQFGGEPLLSRGEYQADLLQILRDSEESLTTMIGGREGIVFLAPMGAHNAIAIEAWQGVGQWDLQEVEETDAMGETTTVVYAVRYGAPEGDPEYKQTLAELKSRITTAATTDAFAGQRIASVSGLNGYYREIGAYDDITPDDGSTATFTPAQPPAPYACAGATVIADPNTKQGLVHDCEALLTAKDALWGTAALNWATTQALSSWDGVTTTGTPERVTGLDLSGESLSGTIPASLGSLFELTELDLSGNSLTGSIPEELGWLHNLDTLRLSGNSLTGCIPLALKDVATNDLSSLNLLYCQPEAPTGVTAGTAAEFSVPVSWTAVDNAAKYEVQYRQRRFGEWTNHATQPTGVSQTVDGLECEVEHQFRVRAFGSGTTYAADWSDASVPVEATTTECVSPRFAEATYEWEAYDDGAAGEALGTAEATDPNDDPVTYSITAGNEANQFRIDATTGQVTLAANVDSALGTVFILTISASDGTNTGTVTVTVNIAASPACGAGLAAPSASSDPALVTDCQALVEARETLEGTQHVNWSARRPMAQWQGVTVAGTPQRVTGLDLSGSSLDGTLPASLGRLSALTDLRLGSNGLTGSIPTGLGDLNSLERLDLSSNGLSDDIPTELGNLANLDSLLLNGNGLTGSIPASLGGITGLQALNLGSNMLSGEIPGELASLEDLTSLNLGGNGLTGSLPSWLGSLADLQSLDLSGNGLTGFIPAELEGLGNLSSLALSGNSLTGCIPSELRDTASHDLDQLGLQYCTAGVDAAPVGLAVSLAEDTFSISWTALAGAARYDAQHRTTAQDSQWESLPEAASAAATLSPAGGAACGTTYQFRVRAHGDGLSRAYGWTPYSEAEELTTVRCNQAPSFTMPSFGFSVAENSVAGTVVGTPLATDLDQGETLTYSITQGNDDSLFTIDGTSGEISVAGGLDHEATPSHTLTVQVEDSLGATATVQVTITVTNVPEGTPPAPTDLSVSLVSGTFTISWTGSNVAARYQAEYRIEGDSAGWTPLPETTTESVTYTPDQELGCGKVYQFQVRAYGDGVTVTGDWGEYSQVVSVLTEACNLEPGFVQERYSFTLAETAASGAAVGSVSATDEDTDDVLTYAITAGNAGNAFSVNTSNGAITVAGSLNYLTASSYTLTLSVSDGRGGEDTVTVTITLESACSNGVVVSNPGDKPGLVADCVILYGSRDLLAGTGSLDWSATTAITTWEGVRIEGTPRRVTYLLLDDRELSGVIPPSLGGLGELRRIDLDVNSLTGIIPAELGSLSKLTHLYLNDNSLTGDIPSRLGELERLQALVLASNSLGGGVPSSLGNLSRLRTLDLSGNDLTGSLPASLGNLTSLVHLLLSDNRLSGNFPPKLGNLWDLETLNLADNSFPGRLPPSFGRLRPTTIYIRGGNNAIHGCMPHGWRDGATHHDLNDGETYWMPECDNLAPAFGEQTYSFGVLESAAVGASVGTASATDADGRTVSYSITAGDEGGKFSVSGTGEITLAGTLDYETTASYSLTLQAQDDDDATSTVTVTITVEDVDES